MHSVLKWLGDNKGWVFSGCGLLIMSGLLSLLRKFLQTSKPNGLTIEIAFGFLTFGSDLSEQMLIFTVSNHSDKLMQVTGIKLPLGKRGNLFFYDLEGERPLPCSIEQGRSLNFWTEVNQIQASLREQGIQGQYSLFAVVVDGVSAEARSKNAVILPL